MMAHICNLSYSGGGDKNTVVCWVPVVQSYNPSYSGGRGPEDLGLKPAQANSSRDSVLKKTLYKKKSGGMAQGEGPEFKSQYHKKKKKQQH
jgi:hypothetical protein